MNQMQEAKKKYDEIPIPAELSERVQEAIAASAEKREQNNKKTINIRSKRAGIFGRSFGTAAAAALIFTVLVNTNTTFAQSVDDIPVIGEIARLVNFRSYEKQNDDMGISVSIPSVEMIAGETNGLADSVNEEIHELCQKYADEAAERAEEYKKAFLATGGSEEEWKAHKIQIQVGYDLKSQSERYLSFVIWGTESWTSAYSASKYYNLDLKSGELVSLKDLLGEDYIQTVNESILSQMDAVEKEKNIELWTPEEGGFTSISDQTPFYIDEEENPVIVFEKYEIAPGSAGEINFTVERK